MRVCCNAYGKAVQNSCAVVARICFARWATCLEGKACESILLFAERLFGHSCDAVARHFLLFGNSFDVMARNWFGALGQEL